MADISFAHTVAATADLDELLRLENDVGQGDRFTEVDRLTAKMLVAALSGSKLATINRSVQGVKNADTLILAPLAERDRPVVEQAFALPAQQSRGAWFLPEYAVLKAGTLNLPSYQRHYPWHSITLADNDVARLRLESTSDAVAAWALLVPLFDTLMAPVTLRATGFMASSDGALETCAAILDSYRRLGLPADDPAVTVFAYRGGWSRLDRASQARARVNLLDALAGVDMFEVASRFRIERVQALVAATLKKARRGTPLARQVLTRRLQPVLSSYFAGDWLSFLNYLDFNPNPNDELVVALPRPRLYVNGSSKAAAVAAEQGMDVDEVHAMLAAFMGQSTSESPVERRVDVLHRWWVQFDKLHARQAAGMPTLWGLTEEIPTVAGSGEGPAAPLYRQVLTPDLVTEVDHLWNGRAIPRWPETIVNEPYPHKLLTELMGPVVKFWQGAALTAWYICEGPYSRTSLSGLHTYHERDLHALAVAGTPVPPALFEELQRAEHFLGPHQDIESNTYEVKLADGNIGLRLSGGGQRRDGFETLRDVITRHRRSWAHQYLSDYLHHRWNDDLTTVARSFHRHIAATGKPPTFRQFAKFATPTANHWFNGNLGSLYTAIGEKPPVTPRRTDPLPTTSENIVHYVYLALGGEYYSDDLRITNFPMADRFRQLARLASASLYYLQVTEALGHDPEPSQFGAKRYEWEWAGGLDLGWPQYQKVIRRVLSELQ